MRQNLFQNTACLLTLLLMIAIGGCGGSSGKKVRPLSEQMQEARDLKDPAERSLALLKVANSYLAAADDLGASNCLMLATESADEIPIRRSAAKRASVYIQIAAGYYQCGQLQDCKDSYKDADKAIRKIDDAVDKTDAYTQLGKLKITIDEPKDAAKDFKKALDEAKDISDLMERVRLLGLVAQGYVDLENKDEANQIMTSTMGLAESQKDPAKKARLLVLIGAQQVQLLDDTQAGIATIEKARQVASSIENNPNQQANVLIDAAATYKDLKNKNEARSLLNEAETLCRGRSECKPAMKRIAKLRDQM